MSVNIAKRVWLIDGLSSTERLVALALADHASDDGTDCYPSVARLATKCACSRRTVQRALVSLEKMRIIRRHPRTDRTTIYLIILANLPAAKVTRATPKELAQTASEHRHIHGYDPATEPDLFSENFGLATGDTVARTGDTVSATGVTVSPEPPYEPPYEPSEESGPALPRPAGTTNSLTAAQAKRMHLADFVQHEWLRLKASNPNMGDCRSITDAMANQIRDRAKEHLKTGETLHDVWIAMFQKIEESDFLRGRAKPGRGYTKSMRMTLSRLLKPHIFREAINDGYNGTEQRSDYDPDSGEVLGPGAAATRGTLSRLRNARERAGQGYDPGGDGSYT